MAAKAVGGGQNEARRSGRRRGPVGIRHARHGTRGVFQRERRLTQGFGCNIRRVELVEIEDLLGQARFVGKAGKAIILRSERVSPETLATRSPTKTRKDTLSVSEEPVSSTWPRRTSTERLKALATATSAASLPACRASPSRRSATARSRVVS